MMNKVAFIGVGSVGFTPHWGDILAMSESQDTHFSLTDINAGNLDMIVELLKKV